MPNKLIDQKLVRMYTFGMVLVMLLGLIRCSDPPSPMLTKAMKKELDSLYTLSLDSIKLEIDVECDKRFTSIYQQAIDSIQDLREEEILNLVN